MEQKEEKLDDLDTPGENPLNDAAEEDENDDVFNPDNQLFNDDDLDDLDDDDDMYLDQKFEDLEDESLNEQTKKLNAGISNPFLFDIYIDVNNFLSGFLEFLPDARRNAMQQLQ